MPSIYKATCSNCGEPPLRYHLGKVVEGHSLLSDQGAAFDDPVRGIVMIPHPGEDGALRVLGAHPLNGDGRVLAWQAVVCSECGAVTERFHVAQRDAGCLLGLAVSLTMGLLLVPFLGVPGGCIVIFVALLLWLNLYDRSERHKWRERDSELELSRCPGCNGEALLALSKTGSGPLPCSHCHNQTMVFETWGIS